MAGQSFDAQAAVRPDAPSTGPSSGVLDDIGEQPANGAGVTMPEQARAPLAAFIALAAQMRSLTKGNADSFMISGRIWGAGCQDMSKDFAATAKTHLDHSMATWKALARVTSMKEAMELQIGHARAVRGEVMAYSSKVADASMTLAERTVAPLSAQMTHNVETLKHTSA